MKLILIKLFLEAFLQSAKCDMHYNAVQCCISITDWWAIKFEDIINNIKLR